jgi:hypothetical protein
MKGLNPASRLSDCKRSPLNRLLADSSAPMQRSSEAARRIREIEAQQDELLAQLEELERRSAAVLTQYAPPRLDVPAVLPLPAIEEQAGQAGRPGTIAALTPWGPSSKLDGL